MRLSLFLATSLATGIVALGACGAPEPETTQTADAPVQTPNAPAPVLTRDQIEMAELTAPPVSGTGASPTPAAATPTASATGQEATPTPAQTPPDAALVRLQILLDRSAFSPGEIDGLPGSSTAKAVAAYREASSLGTGDQVDAALLQALSRADTAPVMRDYTLTQADVSGPFSPPPGSDLATQARLGTNFSNPLERMAERFHIAPALLQGLNPGVDFARAGQAIVVPAIMDAALPQVARIDVLKRENAVRAYDASGKLIAFYPATIGSSDNPSPSGTDLTVNGVAPEPDYLYDPSRLSYGPGGAKVTVPAGPNNPVGTVWIDLSRDTFGIHGTPDPSKVGKTASHGCVRLTNWDAEQLAAAVKPGVTVRFI